MVHNVFNLIQNISENLLQSEDFEIVFYWDTLKSIINLWISTMVTIIKHVAVHSGCQQTKLIHGSRNAVWYE